MKWPLLLLGPIVALIGSLGLFMFGGAMVGVFDVLAFYITDPPQPLPSALAELPWAVLSASVLVVGLVISSVATVMPDSGRAISKTGKLLYTGSAVALMVGSLSLAWAMMGARGSFRIIATSASTPTAEGVQAMIQSVEPTMTIGFAMLVLSAAFLLAAGLAGFQATSAQAKSRRAIIGILFAMLSVVVGLVLLSAILSIWFHANAIEANITGASVAPKPAQLAAHLAGMLNNSLVAFVGFAALGLLQLLTCRFMPSTRPGADYAL